MRSIEFRGKFKKTGKWAYGDLVHSDVGYYIFPLNMEPMGLVLKEDVVVITETIGQFTGVYDRKNRKIYEGDIIKCRNFQDSYYVIEWDVNEVAFCAIRIPKVEYGYKVSPITKSWIAETQKEVIGNIHDKPELLNNPELLKTSI